MAWASGATSRARAEPAFMGLWVRNTRSTVRSSECSPGPLLAVTMTCASARALKTRDPALGAGREDVIEMLNCEGRGPARPCRPSRPP